MSIAGKPYERIEAMMRKHCDGPNPHLFLHPNEYGEDYVCPGLRDFSEEEILILEKRDFETRIFISNMVVEGTAVWLRTHFSENHIHKTRFNVIRDLFKATHATKNFTAAKAALAELLTMTIEVEKSAYHSFAITMASAMSNMGANTSFELNRAIVAQEEDLPLARMKLCLIMHIVFTKISTADFVLDNEGSNIFRLVHCNTVVNKEEHAKRFLPWFSFLLQVCLTAYVITQNLIDGIAFIPGSGTTSQSVEEDGAANTFWQNLPLAIITLGYSGLVAYPSIVEIDDAFKIYGRIGPVQLLDFFVNAILPSVLLVSGFLVILNSDSFIESVLNTAALLFIPEIDDQLPELLGYSEPVIYKNYLVFRALEEYDALSRVSDNAIKEKYLKKIDEAIGVQFSDFYLTNWPEQGSSAEDGFHFKPHQVVPGKMSNGIQNGHSIHPTEFVTSACLIRKITWSYSTGYEYTIKPRIAYLRLEMINGDVVEINMKADSDNVGVDDDQYHLQGAFIITSFQMSGAILRLRLCGSYNAGDFLKAFEYYSLWDISKSAQKMLQKYADHQMKRPVSRNYSPRKMAFAEEDFEMSLAL